MSKLKDERLLEFSPMKNNAKLRLTGGKGYAFSLPAGHSCPFAEQCLSKADRDSGALKDGLKTEFRCFAATMENRFPLLRKRNWRNFDRLRKFKGMLACKGMYDLILDSLPKDATVIRVHVGGDFFSQSYFTAWMSVARDRPDILFYAYTKSVRYWVLAKDLQIGIPKNFVLTASQGGKEDNYIPLYELRSAKVVFSEREAETLGLPIDHDDSHAMANGGDFALLIHGTQPPDSAAGKAWAILKKEGKAGYSAPKGRAKKIAKDGNHGV